MEAYLEGPGGQQDTTGYRVGEEVVVTFTQTGDGSPTFVAVQDRWRLPQLGWLLFAFGLAVIVAAGWRGVRALIALALTAAIVIRILVPLLLQGVPPVPVAVVLATADHDPDDRSRRRAFPGPAWRRSSGRPVRSRSRPSWPR